VADDGLLDPGQRVGQHAEAVQRPAAGGCQRERRAAGAQRRLRGRAGREVQRGFTFRVTWDGEEATPAVTGLAV
jgi:hypothetical protein